MVPITYAGCFGWLHGAEPHERAAGDVGVVLCAGLANEAGSGYLTLRLLADRLAAAGYPVLRYDYPATGNSVDESVGSLIPAWQASVHDSADELRRLTGVTRIVVGGIRFGATLAASAAAQRSDVAGLLLLAPVVSGRYYVRELRAASMIVWNAPPQVPGCLETDGMVFTDVTLRDLADMDLRSSAAMPATHVLIATQTGNKIAHAYAELLATGGAYVTGIPFEGFAAMLRPSQGNEVPVGLLDRVRDWLVRTIPCRIIAPGPARLQAPSLHGPHWHEEALRFGPAQGLFGILCRPATTRHAPCGAPMFVIGNTGIDPHHGYARFHVELARRLAAAGIASLRFDYPGLGDSGNEHADVFPSHCYAADRRQQVAAAMNALTRLGYRRFALGGICSGAYHAFQAALTDTRVEALALVNLETLVWQDTKTALPAEQTSRRSTRFYVQALRSGVALERFRAGKLQLSGVGKTLLRRVLHRADTALRRLVDRMGVRTAAGAPARGLRSLGRRGVRVLFLMGFEEPGLDMLAAHFGGGADRICALPGARLEIEPAIDHALSRASMRALVADRLIAFVNSTIGAAPEPSLPQQQSAAPGFARVKLRTEQ